MHVITAEEARGTRANLVLSLAAIDVAASAGGVVTIGLGPAGHSRLGRQRWDVCRGAGPGLGLRRRHRDHQQGRCVIQRDFRYQRGGR